MSCRPRSLESSTSEVPPVCVVRALPLASVLCNGPLPVVGRLWSLWGWLPIEGTSDLSGADGAFAGDAVATNGGCFACGVL